MDTPKKDAWGNPLGKAQPVRGRDVMSTSEQRYQEARRNGGIAPPIQQRKPTGAG